MDGHIIAVDCLCDDWLCSLNHQGDSQVAMRNAAAEAHITLRYANQEPVHTGRAEERAGLQR